MVLEVKGWNDYVKCNRLSEMKIVNWLLDLVNDDFNRRVFAEWDIDIILIGVGLKRNEGRGNESGRYR